MIVKKPLAVAVILLFIGLAFAPSINAYVSKEKEFVEYTTEICGLNSGKHTVRLAKEEADEVEQLIDDIERRLDEVETREEAVKIFNEAIVELDKYGLLGGLSIEKAQKLVTGDFSIDNRKRILDIGLNLSQNIFCIFSGTARITDPGPYGVSLCAPLGLIFMFGWALGALIDSIGLEKLGLAIAILIMILSFYNPMRFMNIILGLGCGWDITSVGVKGLVKSDEAFLILGYTGLLLYSKDKYSVNMHFLGFCLGFI